MKYQDFPKIELHLHLDCSLSFKVVNELQPEISYSEYQSQFVAPDRCKDLADYIGRASNACALMQTKTQLQMVTQDLFEQLQTDNVVYAEIRFAPLLHLEGGLPADEVVRTVLQEATQAGKDRGIDFGIILCTLRHFSERQSLTTAQLVVDFHHQGVVALDLAADEAGYPIDAHIKAFELVRSSGIATTAHAGEAKGSESVRETLRQLQPQRLGHGVRSIEDPNLLREMAEGDMHLEICPSSNIQVGVFDSLDRHPIQEFYKRGISLSINTDGRALSATTLSQEYDKLESAFGWGYEQFKKCNLEALRHAFIPHDLHRKIMDKLTSAYENF